MNKTKQNIVVLGSTGWIGKRLIQELDLLAHAVPGEVIRQIMEVRNSKARLKELLDVSTNSIFINLIGNRHGSESEMIAANEEFPNLLADILAPSENFIIHLGSAAEYGIQDPEVSISEDCECKPVSIYGRTKLRGTECIQSLDNSVVLRPFNVVGANLDEKNTLSIILNKTRVAMESSQPVTLQNAYTTRDFVPIDFLLRSICKAIELRRTGTYNICTGIPISLNEIIQAIMKIGGWKERIISTSLDSNDVVYGNPGKWITLSGLSTSISAYEIIEIVSRGKKLDL